MKNERQSREQAVLTSEQIRFLHLIRLNADESMTRIYGIHFPQDFFQTPAKHVQ